MTDWPALLDAIDAGLGSFPPVLPEVGTTDTDPLPPGLAERARRTLQRMADVEATLEQHRAGLARELTALEALRSQGRPAAGVPQFLDTRA